MLLPRMQFRYLRTRLAVLYVGLFAAVMACVSVTLYLVVQRAAEQMVRNELVASGTVFDRLWQQRTIQMQDAGGLLAHDFGFRAAVATGDRRTVASALDNLKRRLNVDMAFIVDMDGQVTGIADPRLNHEAAALWTSLDAGQTRGVATFGGRARQIAAAPIMAPALIGWVVFASDLDRGELRQIEKLSAIPLAAAVYRRDEGGRWVEADDQWQPADVPTGKFIDDALAAKLPSQLKDARGTAIAVAKPLRTMAGTPGATLVLRYPMTLALAPYRPLQLMIALVGLLGLLGVMYATWRMTLSITRPISLLDDAADRLAAGERVTIELEGEDELARLAGSFNHMATEIAERERRITQLAFNDALTGLPNRALFHEHLDFQLRGLGRRKVALFCLDLDDFKTINDTLGHPVGDELLRRVGNRLTSVNRDSFVARLGGDEFVIVHPLDENGSTPEQLARAVLQAVDAPCKIDHHDIMPGVSIGIAIAPDDGEDAQTLLRNADLALYRAKEAGRRTWSFFEESLNARAQARRVIENDLRVAIARGQLELYFQPLFDLGKNRISTFEALLRWNHPTRGMIAPTKFIPIAEDTGLIVQMGAWVMREACRQATSWPAHIRVAVNVSSVQFRRPGLADVILQALTVSGLAPDRLEIEITESIFLDGDGETLPLLHGLRELGVRVALDDFGTGYSSLSYLQRFPFDKLKIDRSFINDLLTRPGASAIVRAITDLARALSMETTAEGVEESAQLAELRAHGCSSVQGYLFSRPVPAAAVAAMLDAVPEALTTAQSATA